MEMEAGVLHDMVPQLGHVKQGAHFVCLPEVIAQNLFAQSAQITLGRTRCFGARHT